MQKIPAWVWTLLFLLVIPVVTALLVLRQPSVNDLITQSRALALAGDIDGAIAMLDSALTQHPEDAALYVERGQQIVLLFEWDRARADFDRALTIDPTYAEGFFFRGVLFASVPDASARSTAISDFEEYLRLAPEGEHAEDAQHFIRQLRPPDSE